LEDSLKVLNRKSFPELGSLEEKVVDLVRKDIDTKIYELK